jgi:hypothetical protein
MRWSIVAILLLVAGASPAAAQHTSRDVAEGVSSLARAPLRSPRSHVTTIQDASGSPILMIDYPWTMHARTSIEVASLPEDPAGYSEVRPLFFFNKLFSGVRKVAIFECQDGSAEAATTASFVEEGTAFEVIGQRNSLGNPSAVVTSHTQIEEISAIVSHAVFCLLDPWTVNRRLLQLDLPPEQFAKPGKIRIWFLRDDVVLWSEDVPWPGFPQ